MNNDQEAIITIATIQAVVATVLSMLSGAGLHVLWGAL